MAHVGYAPRHPETANLLCLHEILALQVECTPKAIALDDGTRTLTYQELDTQANQLAWVLRERGVGPNMIVGLGIRQGRKDMETLISMLAIHKAGGAWVVLDHYYPELTLHEMIHEAEVALVLTIEQDEAQRLEQVIANEYPPVLCLEHLLLYREAERQPTTPPVTGVTPHDLAYIIYSSGSTGKPKGIFCTHEHLYPLARFHGDYCEITGSTRLSQVLPWRWDGALFMTVLALGNGATLCLPPPEALHPGPQTVAWLESAQVSMALFTPTFLAHLPEATLPRLKALFLAGEPCPKGLADQWRAEGERQIYFAYGPAEGPICASIYRWDGVGVPTMGFPPPYVQLALLDKAGQEVPRGTIGQVVIYNPPSLGYTDKTLTEQRYAVLPDGRRAYFSGDHARFLDDGALEWAGREDDQHKLHGGVLVNLAEIEQTIGMHPMVRTCKVILREDESIIGYVVLKEPHQLEMAALRAYLHERLAPPLMPACCLELASLPFKETSKASNAPDDYPLPTEAAHATYLGAFRAPRTSMERKLTEVVLQMTRHRYPENPAPTIDDINVRLTLEELGIDSLAVGRFEALAFGFTHRYLSDAEIALPLSHVALAYEGGKASMLDGKELA